MRMTMKGLEAKVTRLNTILNRPLTAWTKTEQGLKANIGNYHLSGSYGYTNLHCMCNENGGVHSVKSGTKQDIADYIDAFIAGYVQAKEDMRGDSK